MKMRKVRRESERNCDKRGGFVGERKTSRGLKRKIMRV